MWFLSIYKFTNSSASSNLLLSPSSEIFISVVFLSSKIFLCIISLLISLFDETVSSCLFLFLPLKSYCICLSLCLVTSQIILAKSFFFLTMWSLWYWVLEETAMGKRTATLGWQWFWQHCLSLALSQTTTQLLTSTNCWLMALLFSLMPWGTQLLFSLIELNLGFFTGIVFLRSLFDEIYSEPREVLSSLFYWFSLVT